MSGDIAFFFMALTAIIRVCIISDITSIIELFPCREHRQQSVRLHTSEFSDTDDKPNKVKFTWCYAENRPFINLHESPGIFNDKFNPVFS